MKDIVYFHAQSILSQHLFYKDLMIWPVRINDSWAQLIINPNLKLQAPKRDASGKIIGQSFTLEGNGGGIGLVLDCDANRDKNIEAHGSRYSLHLIQTTAELMENYSFFVAEIEIEELSRPGKIGRGGTHPYHASF